MNQINTLRACHNLGLKSILQLQTTLTSSKIKWSILKQLRTKDIQEALIKRDISLHLWIIVQVHKDTTQLGRKIPI